MQEDMTAIVHAPNDRMKLLLPVFLELAECWSDHLPLKQSGQRKHSLSR